jgi:hypothetical protein
VTVFGLLSVMVCGRVVEPVDHGLWPSRGASRSRSVTGSWSLSVTVCEQYSQLKRAGPPSSNELVHPAQRLSKEFFEQRF